MDKKLRSRDPTKNCARKLVNMRGLFFYQVPVFFHRDAFLTCFVTRGQIPGENEPT